MGKFNENLSVILEHIASYGEGDIDSEVIELRFEDENGNDTGCDVDLREVCEEAAEKIKNSDKLLDCLAEISSMCVGEVAMDYKLDAGCIGEMIYEATGLTQPELCQAVNNNRQAACNRGES